MLLTCPVCATFMVGGGDKGGGGRGGEPDCRLE